MNTLLKCFKDLTSSPDCMRIGVGFACFDSGVVDTWYVALCIDAFLFIAALLNVSVMNCLLLFLHK